MTLTATFRPPGDAPEEDLPHSAHAEPAEQPVTADLIRVARLQGIHPRTLPALSEPPRKGHYWTPSQLRCGGMRIPTDKEILALHEQHAPTPVRLISSTRTA